MHLNRSLPLPPQVLRPRRRGPMTWCSTPSAATTSRAALRCSSGAPSAATSQASWRTAGSRSEAAWEGGGSWREVTAPRARAGCCARRPLPLPRPRAPRLQVRRGAGHGGRRLWHRPLPPHPLAPHSLRSPLPLAAASSFKQVWRGAGHGGDRLWHRPLPPHPLAHHSLRSPLPLAAASSFKQVWRGAGHGGDRLWHRARLPAECPGRGPLLRSGGDAVQGQPRAAAGGRGGSPGAGWAAVRGRAWAPPTVWW
jgi:hypothetical protein